MRTRPTPLAALLAIPMLAACATTLAPTPAPVAVPVVEEPTVEPVPSASASAAASASADATIVRPGEAWLVLQTRTSGYGVHFVRPDGTGLHRWSADVPGIHEHPDWSPDGQRILLNTVMPDETEDLWVGNADGSDARLLLDCVAPCVWLDEAAWSPDGTHVAVQRVTRGDDGGFISTLEQLDVATGETTVILTMPTQEVVLAPRWSPDGRHIVVEHLHLVADDIDADIDRGGIGVVDLDDDRPTVTPITDGDFSNSPDWSPDGSLVLWSRPGATGGSDVWVAAPDGSDARRVTDVAAGGGGADQPAFTPDGTGIVFVWSEPGRPTRIGQVDLDGSDLRFATGEWPVDGMHPRWRPVADPAS